MRVEPLNSDDVALFGIATHAVEGGHWLFEGQPPPELHQHLRLGFLPLLAPFVHFLGPTHVAFYAAPIAVAALGFWICWRIMLKEAGFGLAVAFALLHMALPLEVMRASLPLVDLPSAVFVMLAIFLVDRLAREEPASLGDSAWRGAVAGLAGVGAYLLRTNSVMLLAPGLAILGFSRRTRWIALFAGLAIALGVGLEQLFYVAHGEAFGYRWQVVQAALQEYSPFLPLVPVEEFPGRYFKFADRAFGGGLAGEYMRGFLVVSLVAHIFALLRGKPMIRALAATGILTFVSFAYGIYSWEDSGIRALAPTNYRYLQLFYYTSIVLLAWGSGRIAAAVTTLEAERGPGLTALYLGVAVVALAPFHISARYVGPRVTSDEGLVRSVTCALDEAAQANGGAVSVHSSDSASRVIRLFRGSWSEPRVDWQIADLDELLEMPAAEAPFLFFDHWRLQLSARYQDEGVAGEYERSLALLGTRLWQAYEPLIGREHGAFYRQRQESNGAAGTSLPWRTSSGPTVEEEDGRTFRVLATPATETFYLATGSGNQDRKPPAGDPRAALSGESVYALRFHLDHPDSLPVVGTLYQFGARKVMARQKLFPRRSWNTVHFEPAPGAVSFGVSLFFQAEGLETPAPVSIRDTELRAWPAVGNCATRGEIPTRS